MKLVAGTRNGRGEQRFWKTRRVIMEHHGTKSNTSTKKIKMDMLMHLADLPLALPFSTVWKLNPSFAGQLQLTICIFKRYVHCFHSKGNSNIFNLCFAWLSCNCILILSNINAIGFFGVQLVAAIFVAIWVVTPALLVFGLVDFSVPLILCVSMCRLFSFVLVLLFLCADACC